MQNSQRDQELEKKLLFSILEYLQSLTTGENTLGLDRESLQVAIDCLSSAVKINVSDPHQRQMYSVGPINLPHIFSLGLARKEQLELTLKQVVMKRNRMEYEYITFIQRRRERIIFCHSHYHYLPFSQTNSHNFFLICLCLCSNSKESVQANNKQHDLQLLHLLQPLPLVIQQQRHKKIQNFKSTWNS
jgi:hypothetical protein